MPRKHARPAAKKRLLKAKAKLVARPSKYTHRPMPAVAALDLGVLALLFFDTIPPDRSAR